MAQLDDLIAKYLATAVLEARGATFPEKEIPMMDAQAADFYFVPRAGPRRTGPIFRQFDEMTAAACTLEFCSRIPSVREFCRGPLRKHVELFQARWLEGARKSKREPAIQVQWLLLPGLPARLIQELPCTPMPGWPLGTCYRFSKALKVRLVVLPALARTRETLLLRLLGPLSVRQPALAELKLIPATDPEIQDLLSMLACVSYMIEKDSRIPQSKQEEFMNTNAVRQEFEKFKEGLIQQGLEKGMEKGLARGIMKVLHTRGLHLSQAQEQRLLTCSNPTLLDLWLERAVVAPTIDDVFAS